MVYFFNTNLSHKKKIAFALTKIYGLGLHQCSQICQEVGLSTEKRFSQLSQAELEILTNFITQNYILPSDIKRAQMQNISRLVRIGTYRGFRHTQGLPVRGQKTHGNSKTVRKLTKIPKIF